MSISEPVNSYDKLDDKGIVRIMLSILLAGFVIFLAIGIGGALGVVPNTCTGPGQRIMHARCEGPTNLTTIPSTWEFYPGYSPTTNFSNTAPLDYANDPVQVSQEKSILGRPEDLISQ